MLNELLDQKAFFGGFCERHTDYFPVELWNSISNLGYFVAVYFLLKSFGKNAKAYSILLTILGISSFLYHGTFTRVFQLFDLTSIYLIITYIILKTFNIKEVKALVISIIISIILFLGNVLMPEMGRNFVIILAVLGVTFLLLKYRIRAILPV